MGYGSSGFLVRKCSTCRISPRIVIGCQANQVGFIERFLKNKFASGVIEKSVAPIKNGEAARCRLIVTVLNRGFEVRAQFVL